MQRSIGHVVAGSVLASAVAAQGGIVTSGLLHEWVGDQGLSRTGTVPYALQSNDTWDDTQAGNVWTVLDNAPAGDISVVSTAGTGIASTTTKALRQPGVGITTGLRLNHAALNVGTGGGQAVSFELYYRSTVDAPSSGGYLLETGGSSKGIAISYLDAGLVGDDTGTGRFDDIRVTVGGASAGGTLSALGDAPNNWAQQYIQIVGVYNEGGDGLVKIYIDGALAGQSSSAISTLDWQGTDPAALFGLNGTPGSGLSVTGANPQGELAILRWYDRGLSAAEVAQNYQSTVTIPEPAIGAIACSGSMLLLRARRRQRA